MTMVIHSVMEWQTLRKNSDPKLTIGFVPTMGNLHQGHASLLERAKKENDLCVLSIFVNQTQFNDKKDFDNYPKTLEADLALAKKLGVDYVLIPDYAAMYPDDYRYRLCENHFSALMEGAHRPGHFDGVLTIVMKLFGLVSPTKAYFGEKDYQQMLLIQGMVAAFFMPIEIVPCPTIRQENGLALSSRNGRLNPQDLEKAAIFSQMLHSNQNEDTISQQLRETGFEVDYIEKWQNRRFGAVKIGGIRLIDNIALIDDNSVN